MKKRNFFVLSAAALLALCACGGGGKGNGGNTSSSQEPEPGGKGYVDPEVDLDDAAEANIDIAFDEVTDTCMINQKAKTYIDAMEEQEKTLDRPYHFSSLYGPDDYAKIAAAADKGDGTTYAPEDTGGVDVCQILRNSDDSGYCKNYPIKITWDDEGSFDGGKVKFWSKEDKSDLREANITKSGSKAQAELPNLFRATKYRVQAFSADESYVSNSFEFKTGDYPRTMSFGGIKNVRDIGGFVTSYGVRSNQGLIYRGYYIDDGNPSSHGQNYNAETQKVQEEVMKISVELDLQKSSETGGRTTSAINSAAIPVEYKCLTLVSYDNFLKQDSYKNLPEVMHLLANADQKHVYFHCWGGADRTGMLDFFVNAILGVSYTDIIEEFELTTQTNNKRCHMHNSSSAHYPKFMNAFINGYTENGKTWVFDPDATVNENCERWLLEYAGVASEDIERIREIMLPGYADGELKKDALIPEPYTPGDEWVSDDLAHWKVAKEDSNVKCNWHRHDGAECSVCGHGKSSGGDPAGSSSNPASSSSQGGGAVDYLVPLTRVWKEGTPANNSDGKQYIPLSEEATGKAGVEIKFSDYSPDSTATVSGGKIGPVNDSTVSLTYRIKAPKAGTYQMVMNGRVSKTEYTLDQRKFKVTLNGETVDVQGADRDGGLKGDGDNDFVAAPSINLTGNEDVFTVACCDNRIVFVESAYIVFIEH